MKKLVLLFTGLLMGLTTVTATEKKEKSLNKVKQLENRISNNNYNFIEPIQFIERGVEFLIFPDGAFDFNTNIESNHNNYNDGYYRNTNTKRSGVNRTFGAPGTQVTYSTPRSRGVIVTHDNDGKVRRVGNVFVNYNRYNQVKRLGSVYMKYNRKGWLTQVGGLRIKYNRFGQIIKTTGFVNFRNKHQGNLIQTSPGNHSNNQGSNWNTNNGHYYYKKDGKVLKKKKIKTVKPKQ
ncbi:hypothetical protein [Lacinutrix sp. 5H-3-7-4]|uniref:hypothetical protein n=1 Tax=Lacinutrix sp. (strain 5H-3-7-4) TaxID=983544 RepID=UPI00020A36B4|nr:hypothetical protein [Lacinutrix sp. 5H-3-7-4]AEH02212.1 hypothetical protein Lacal_2370 [Lacinutrix sp. 5H-3-7-4]